MVKNGERFDFVLVESIDWVESANNYVQLHCGGKAFLLAETLTNLEGKLNPDKFLRVHRSRIVNTSRVLAVHPMLGERMKWSCAAGPASQPAENIKVRFKPC